MTYSLKVITPDACASLFFVKGHGLRGDSVYYVTYSEVTCALTFSRTFPVESGDGRTFTIVIASVHTGDVAYELRVRVTSPLLPPSVLSLLIVLPIGMAVGAAGIFLLRRMRPPVTPPANPSHPELGGPIPRVPPEPPGRRS